MIYKQNYSTPEVITQELVHTIFTEVYKSSVILNLKNILKYTLLQN